MNIEGKLKLEIRDAKTGELKEVREETNMVTDSVYNVINGAVARARKGNYSQLQLGTSTEDIVRMLFGGVMVFSEAVDTTHLVPSALEMHNMVGNGNQQATIAGSGYKGNLRSATVSEDSAEFIWDFAATQCNGTIASICLTSNKGGELGCKIEAIDSSRYSDSFIYGLADVLGYDKHIDFNASYPRTNLMSFSGGTSGEGLRVYTGNKLVHYRGNYKYTWDLSKYKNRFDFTEAQVNIPTIAAEQESTDTAIPGTTGNVGGNLIKGPITDYALKGQCTFEPSGDGYKYTLVLTKCTATSQSTVNVPMNNLITAIKAKYADKGCDTPADGQNTAYNINNSIVGNCFTWDNKLFWFVGNYNNSDTEFLSIYVQEFDGSYVVINDITEDTAFYNLIGKASITNWNGVLYGTSSLNATALFDIFVLDTDIYVRANDFYFLLSIDADSDLGLYMDNRPNFYIKNGKVCLSRIAQDDLAAIPFYRALGNAVGNSSNNALGWCVNSILRTNYLATIQNQSNPAVKTPSDIMSITYTLTRRNS